MAFFSADSHYSIRRALDIVDVPTFAEVGELRYPGLCPSSDKKWPDAVPSVGKDHRYGTGEIDVEELAELVEFFARRNHRILIVLNVGTTFKGAYDDVKAVAARLAPIFAKYGLDDVGPAGQPERRGYWIHVDGALGATYLPFLEKAHNQGLTQKSVPIFDFRVDAVHSIVASGHKWPGAPWPCGIYMTLQKYQIEPPAPVSYIGAADTTLAGSRNGLSALLLWSRLSRLSEDEEIALVMTALELTDYLFEQLCLLDKKKAGRLDPARTANALTVRFVKPVSDDIVKRYSLSSADVPSESGEKIEYVHAYVMPHVTKGLIDQFVRDLGKEKWEPPHARRKKGNSS